VGGGWWVVLGGGSVGAWEVGGGSLTRMGGGANPNTNCRMAVKLTVLRVPVNDDGMRYEARRPVLAIEHQLVGRHELDRDHPLMSGHELTGKADQVRYAFTLLRRKLRRHDAELQHPHITITHHNLL